MAGKVCHLTNKCPLFPNISSTLLTRKKQWKILVNKTFKTSTLVNINANSNILGCLILYVSGHVLTYLYLNYHEV